MIRNKLLGFDLETVGDKQEYALQPFRALRGEAYISAASVASDVDRMYGVLSPSVDDLEKFLTVALNKGLYVTGWNVAFDAAWCIASGLEELVFKVKWLDAMLLWRHAVVEPEGEDVPAYKRKKYALVEAIKEFHPELADFKEFDDFQATDEESLQQLLYRNKMDAATMIPLAERFWSMLSEKQQRAALIEAKCIPLMAKTRVAGLSASMQAAEQLSDVLSTEALSIYKQLIETNPEVRGVNLNSSPQLVELIYEKWGLMPTRFSKKTGKPSTDKYALFDLAAIDKRADLLKKLREAKNNRTKYAQGTIKSLKYNGDGFVRPQAKIFSTYTSRITYGSSEKAVVEVVKETKKGIKRTTKKTTVPSGIALHQWKRGKEYRQIVKPPEGFGLAELDFDGQEYRWMGVASGDPTMLSLCAPGEDPHTYMGSQIAECDYKELMQRVAAENVEAAKDRKAGKFCNLSYQYRISYRAATVKARVDYGMDVTEDFIQLTQAIYKQSYPLVQQYWRTQINKCKQLGYAETFAGRRVQLKGNWVGKTAWPMESTAINYPIQGTGGDQKYLALAVARNFLPKYGGYFYFELHDGLFFIFPLDKIIKATEELREILSNLPYKQAWGVDLPVKFPVSAEIGPSWGGLMSVEKYKER